MKTIVGVDLAGNYAPALELCLELDFPHQHYVFVNAVEPVPAYAPPLGAAFDNGAWITHLRNAGETAVTKAEARVCRNHIQSHSQVTLGAPTATLMTIADDEKADLIALGSAKRSGIGSFFSGSVARGMTIGAHQSLLVTKAPEFPKRPIRAIFATDHSEYAKRALEKLIQWAPKGISQIDVISAYEVEEGYVVAVPDHIIDTGVAIADVIRDHLVKMTEEASTTLARAGYLGEAQVVRGFPNTVIGEQMKIREADLLIIGAQGHGFFERLLVGSTALHQVVAESYPVLVIRP
jgi:nucleotide-binding universal stress UspA family protein